MMMTDYLLDRVREADAADDTCADRRVNLHLLELGGGQLAGLVENVFGDCELTYVVQERARLQRFEFRGAHVQVSSEFDGVDARTPNVPVRGLVFRVNGDCQRLYGAHVQFRRLTRAPQLFFDGAARVFQSLFIRAPEVKKQRGDESARRGEQDGADEESATVARRRVETREVECDRGQERY